MPTSKIIISCAVAGSIHTPTLSGALPYRAEDIAQQSIDAARAAILHLHARDPNHGRPSGAPDHFMALLPQIKAGCDAVINLSTGGSAVMTLDQRVAAPKAAAPEMCSLNMGTINFAFFPMAARHDDWVFDWEKPFLEGTDDLVFKNKPHDIAGVLHIMGTERGARFEFEYYNTGHLTMLRQFVSRGPIEPLVFMQFVFGILGGMAATADNLIHMKRLADTYFGDAYQFSVFAAGRQQIPLAVIAAGLGGHVRVGLEDPLYISEDVLARSNVEQVTTIRGLVEGLGRKIAGPDEAREMLDLKGVANVAF